jgi:hypothetical protein
MYGEMFYALIGAKHLPSIRVVPGVNQSRRHALVLPAEALLPPTYRP